MTDTPELDHAIVVARSKVASVLGWTPKDDDRTYFRAGIAELLRGMEPTKDMTPAARGGFMRAVRELERRAGIVEGEG